MRPTALAGQSTIKPRELISARKTSREHKKKDDDDVELNVLRCRADMATRKTAGGVYTPRIEIYSHARSQLAVGDWGLCCSCVRVTSFQR